MLSKLDTDISLAPRTVELCFLQSPFSTITCSAFLPRSYILFASVLLGAAMALEQVLRYYSRPSVVRSRLSPVLLPSACLYIRAVVFKRKTSLWPFHCSIHAHVYSCTIYIYIYIVLFLLFITASLHLFIQRLFMLL